MKVQILLSIGYIILFALLGNRASQPNHPPYVLVGLVFVVLTVMFSKLWIDTVSRKTN